MIEILIVSVFATVVWAAVIGDWARQRYGDRVAVWWLNRRHRRRWKHLYGEPPGR